MNFLCITHVQCLVGLHHPAICQLQLLQVSMHDNEE